VRRVRFIPHAETALLERGIERDWIIDTMLIRNASKKILPAPAANGRFDAFRNSENRWLRVAYDTVPDELQVITAFFDRRAGRRK